MHILGVGLAVHEKLVHPEMRPLHKKLVDQFHMMRTGLHHVSFHFSFLNILNILCKKEKRLLNFSTFCFVTITNFNVFIKNVNREQNDIWLSKLFTKKN